MILRWVLLGLSGVFVGLGAWLLSLDISVLRYRINSHRRPWRGRILRQLGILGIVVQFGRLIWRAPGIDVNVDSVLYLIWLLLFCIGTLDTVRGLLPQERRALEARKLRKEMKE